MCKDELKSIDQEILETELKLKRLQEQRRDIINRHDLNKYDLNKGVLDSFGSKFISASYR